MSPGLFVWREARPAEYYSDEMRPVCFIAAVFLAVCVFGCAPKKDGHVKDDCCALTPVRAIDQTAIALAYGPPAHRAEELQYGVGLASNDRDSRGTRAFAGYQSLVAEYFWLRTDDRFRYDQSGYSSSGGTTSVGRDRYERRAISTRIGVTHR